MTFKARSGLTFINNNNNKKMSCKGICVRYKASARYANGHKHCKVCDLFIKWDGLFCPCCGYKTNETDNFEIKGKAKRRKSNRRS